MPSQAEYIHNLFKRYLEICNSAIDEHKREFPYKHIWEAAENMQNDEGVHLIVYDDEPKGDYQVKIKKSHLEILDNEKTFNSSGWRVNTSYLRRVVGNPDEYIKEPAKLDWNWLKYSSKND